MLRCRHFHRFPIPIRMILRSRQVRVTLASRTVVHNLVTEHITINAEMILASLTLIPAGLAGAFSTFGAHCITRAAVGAVGGRRERRQAAETLR